MRRPSRVDGRARRYRPGAQAALLALLSGTATLTPVSAAAQQWMTEASVSTVLTATDNGALAPEGAEKSDFVAWVQPRLRLVGRGPRFDLSLDARADALGYARDTQDNRVLPGGNANLKATLVERLLFFDAGLGVNQVESDPFGARVVDGRTGNRSTAASYRIRPYLDYQISARSSLLALHEESGIHSFDDEIANSRSRLTQLRFDAKPLPLGGGFEASRLENLDQSNANQALSNDALRAHVNATFGGDMIVGLVLGRERSEFLSTTSRDTIYGVRLDWAPSPRTRVRGVVEERFFGTGGELEVSYGTPLMALTIEAARRPSTSVTLATPISGRADVSAFLDSILESRYPEKTERAPIVSDAGARRSFETQLPSSIFITAGYPQLQTGGKASLALYGLRTTVLVSAYYQQLRLLEADDTASATVPVADADSRQWGTGVEVVRRLNRQMSASVLFRWSEINGLGARSNDETRDWNLRAALTRQLAPQTFGSVGVQYRNIQSNIGGDNRYAETAALIGLNHRF